MTIYNSYYEIKKENDICFFLKSKKPSSYNNFDLTNVHHIIICDYLDDDFDFLQKIILQTEQTDFHTISFFAKSFPNDAIDKIDAFLQQIRDLGKTVNVSLEYAAATRSSNAYYIAIYQPWFSDNQWLLYYYQINPNPCKDPLKVDDYRTILPKAQELANEIKQMELNTLEQIVWLDNWMQKNVQYIKGTESTGLLDPINAELGTTTFVCDKITKQAIVPDVLLRNYGTCEDIAASIATILYYLGIDYQFVSFDCHAWLLVKVDNTKKYYIWDCTHNITRNPNRMKEALKATKYTDSFTLIGQDTYKDKYFDFSALGFETSQENFNREEIESAKQVLIDRYHVSFEYGEVAPYKSYIKENQ